MEKYRHIIEIYNPNTKLPSSGWLQSCICCNAITSHTNDLLKIEVYYYTLVYKVYVCVSCENKILGNRPHPDSQIEYDKKVINLTRKKFFKQTNLNIINHLKKHNINTTNACLSITYR